MMRDSRQKSQTSANSVDPSLLVWDVRKPKSADSDPGKPERKDVGKFSPSDSFDLDDVVVTSKMKLSDVKKEFNGDDLNENNNPTYYSWWFGTVLQPNEYYMAHVDQKPVLIPPSTNGLGVAMRWFSWFWYNLFGTIKIVKQTDEFYGAFDKHVLNVQPGKYAKMYTSEGPVLYGPGTHVIKDPNCRTRLDGSTGAPETVNATDPYIHHGNVHILNVPQGKVAKVIVDGVYKLLEGNSKPYVFHSSRFEVSHAQHYLVDANTSCIIHGPIKRLLPDEAQVYIVSKGGKFETIKTQEDQKPVRLDSPFDTVIGALPMGLHTPKFPSKYLEEYRVNHEKMPITDAAYNFYTTQDGLRLGLKIVATYKISDPLALVKSLPVHDVKGSDQGIAMIEHLNQRLHKHIESMIEAKMQFAITHTMSTDFLPNMRDIADEKARDVRSLFVSADRKETSVIPATSPTAPDDMPHALLEVQNQLKQEFAKIGIELGNLLIDQIKIDPQVQVAMAQLALKTKELENERVLAERKQNLELQQAHQRSVISAKDADTRLAVARIDAEAKQTLASVYENKPALVQLEMADKMRDAMKGAKATFIIGNTSGASGQPFSFFPTATGLPAPGRVLDEKVQQRV